MMNLTDIPNLYNIVDNATNHAITLCESVLNNTYNFNYSGIIAPVKNFMLEDAPIAAYEFNNKAYTFVTQDTPNAIYESASLAANNTYAAGLYISDNIISARDTAANMTQESIDMTCNAAQSAYQQCQENEVCASVLDAAPYAAVGAAALAAVGIAYTLYGYMQDKKNQDSLIQIATDNEPEVTKDHHACCNHDHHAENSSALKPTAA